MGYGVAVGWAAIPCLTRASIVASTARSWASPASTAASRSGAGATSAGDAAEQPMAATSKAMPANLLSVRLMTIARSLPVSPCQPVTCPPKTGPGVKLDLGWMKGGEMPNKRHTPEQVINKLREAEVAMAQGSTVAEASRQIGVTQQTFYRWRNEYGGLRIDQV